jgi:hypothetical protein
MIVTGMQGMSIGGPSMIPNKINLDKHISSDSEFEPAGLSPYELK